MVHLLRSLMDHGSWVMDHGSVESGLVLEFQRSPAIPTRDTGIWSPRSRNPVAHFLIRQFIQTIQIPNCAPHPKVVVWENIESAKRKDQKHLGCPYADALHLD